VSLMSSCTSDTAFLSSPRLIDESVGSRESKDKLKRIDVWKEENIRWEESRNHAVHERVEVH
jgi:hypothetical protein